MKPSIRRCLLLLVILTLLTNLLAACKKEEEGCILNDNSGITFSGASVSDIIPQLTSLEQDTGRSIEQIHYLNRTKDVPIPDYEFGSDFFGLPIRNLDVNLTLYVPNSVMASVDYLYHVYLESPESSAPIRVIVEYQFLRGTIINREFCETVKDYAEKTDMLKRECRDNAQYTDGYLYYGNDSEMVCYFDLNPGIGQIKIRLVDGIKQLPFAFSLETVAPLCKWKVISRDTGLEITDRTCWW